MDAGIAMLETAEPRLEMRKEATLRMTLRKLVPERKCDEDGHHLGKRTSEGADIRPKAEHSELNSRGRTAVRATSWRTAVVGRERQSPE